VGAQWLGETALGSKDANLTTPTGGALRLFSTSTSLAGVSGLEARAGVHVWHRVHAEAFGSFSKPPLNTSVANDYESSPSTTASETIKQYIVGGSAVWYLPQSPGSRFFPFASGSVAYLRQLHESDTLASTGRLYELGGGIKYLLRSQATGLKGAGVRGDVRVQLWKHGVAFDEGLQSRPTVVGAFFVRF